MSTCWDNMGIDAYTQYTVDSSFVFRMVSPRVSNMLWIVSWANIFILETSICFIAGYFWHDKALNQS